MKTLIKMVIQFPEVFLVYIGTMTYIHNTALCFTVFVLAMLIYDIAEKFLGKS